MVFHSETAKMLLDLVLLLCLRLWSVHRMFMSVSAVIFQRLFYRLKSDSKSNVEVFQVNLLTRVYLTGQLSRPFANTTAFALPKNWLLKMSFRDWLDYSFTYL